MIFSIIIATCDRPERLARALNAVSIAAGNMEPGQHVMVVDNGRAATARETVVSLCRETGLDVEYIETEPRNKCKALNAGIAHARAEWLAFTDDDCLPDPGWLQNAAACIETTGWRCFGGRVVPGEADEALPLWLKPGRSGRIPSSGVFIRYEPRSESGPLDNFAPVPLGANFFAKKEVFEKYGGYDEDLWRLCGKAALGVEDGEFGLRLRRKGEPLGYCGKALVVHPLNKDRYGIGSHLKLAYYYGWRNPLIFPEDKGLRTALYQFRVMIRMAAGSILDLCLFDLPGAVDRWVRMAHSAGGLAGLIYCFRS